MLNQKTKTMEQKDKDLLLADLCGRLPHGVIISVKDINNFQFDGILQVIGKNWCRLNILDPIKKAKVKNQTIPLNHIYIKPYLRPMSNMTEEEKLMYEGLMIGTDNVSYMLDVIDWLNKRMFDFRGLIPKGLAEIAPEGMYELKLLEDYLPSQNESDSVIDNTTKITVGCKIRSKTNPNEILSIISDDCHGDEFECANGNVLSLKQIEKYYDLIK